MKKFMKKLNMKMIAMIIIIAAMTKVGIYNMENVWVEGMSGVIYLVGELVIIGVLAYKPATRFAFNETKKLIEMSED